jgi:hypothetical protein
MQAEHSPSPKSDPDPDAEVAGFVIEVAEPTQQQLLAQYAIYRYEVGGEPYEPLESQLQASEYARNSDVSAGDMVHSV